MLYFCTIKGTPQVICRFGLFLFLFGLKQYEMFHLYTYN